ncbi:M48 family metalloprotease [Candidatus Uhrbacteria bacterium]|nr:M48 family metalloprotease [Candidatus Uhrbacteria bacterium]
MYNHIAANKRKTILLIALFMALVVVIGYTIGLQNGDVYGAMMSAAVFSGLFSIVSYYQSNKIALLSSGARLIQKQDHPVLWHTVETLAITSGLPMPRVAIIEDRAMNAFATGRDPKHAVVAVTRGLLDGLSKVELEGVLAHEMSHVQNYDIRLMTVVVVLVGTLALLADLFRFGFGGRREENGGGSLALVGIVLLLLSPLIGELIKLAVGRSREYLADASGALLTRYPEGLASALEKISADRRPLKRANHATAHLYIKEPFEESVLTRLFSTHPPVTERIARLRNMAS